MNLTQWLLTLALQQRHHLHARLSLVHLHLWSKKISNALSRNPVSGLVARIRCPPPLWLSVLMFSFQLLARWSTSLYKLEVFRVPGNIQDAKPRLEKPNSEATLTKLRSISNLIFASKLSERAVFLQTHDHLTTHNLYLLVQSSYRQHHSTETALLRVKNDILLNMN